MTDRYHHGDLRRQLLLRAGDVLESQGPDAITLRGLARSLGVSHTAPSHHFADRDALLIALAAQGHDMLQSAMTERLATDHHSPAQVAIGEGYLDFALTHPQRFRLMFAGIADLHPSASPDFAKAAQASFSTLVQVTDTGRRAATDPSDWLSAWALVHGLATLWVDGVLASGFTGDNAVDDFRSIATTILSDHTRASRGSP